MKIEMNGALTDKQCQYYLTEKKTDLKLQI